FHSDLQKFEAGKFSGCPLRFAFAFDKVLASLLPLVSALNHGDLFSHVKRQDMIQCGPTYFRGGVGFPHFWGKSLTSRYAALGDIILALGKAIPRHVVKPRRIVAPNHEELV